VFIVKHTAHVVVAVAAAGLFLARGPAGCDVASIPTSPATTTPGHAAVSHSGSDGSFSADCDGNGKPVNVRPDTPAAKSKAAQYCTSVQHDYQVLESVVQKG
jgi:hypothetical protein